MTYWVGEAMHAKDLKDLAAVPKDPVNATRNMVTNAVHLAARSVREPLSVAVVSQERCHEAISSRIGRTRRASARPAGHWS